MNHDEWFERAEIYALGALDAEEKAEFEAHLASGCRWCEERVRETCELLVDLPRSLSRMEPLPVVKARLLQQIGAPAKRQPSGRPISRWLWAAVGAAALAAASVIIVLRWDLIVARQELQRLQNQIAALQTEVSQREGIIQFLSDPQVHLVSLAGLPPSPGARAQLLWNSLSRTGLLLTTGLPPTATDKTYELWGIAGAEPVPAGVFRVNEQGQVLFRLPTLPQSKRFDKFAVTVEPAGGVPQPTGTMVLLGSL